MHPAYSHLSVHLVSWQDFGLYDYRTLFKKWGLLGTDAVNLTVWGKSVFTNRRAGRKWKSAQLQHCGVIGFAETQWDS